MSILLIEDDEAASAYLAAQMADEGYGNVTIASSIADATRWLDGDGARPPDLVLLDIGLPDGNGLDLCRRLKRAPRFETVPVIVVSAVDDDCTVEEALDAGACDYLHKPVRPRELAARVRAALRARRHDVASSSRQHQLLGLAERLRKTNEELARLSGTDALTNVPNRRHFNLAYRREWRRASRIVQPLALAMFDVDDFHAFNERYGHPAGDQCLVAIASTLASCGRRPSDLFARYGGEEFLFMLPDTDLDGARTVAERGREAVLALGVPHAGSRCAPHVTVSVGVASLTPRPELSPEVLLSASDDALLRAKQWGRNRVAAPDGESSGADLIQVEVDPIIALRVPSFLANRRRDVRTLLEAAERGRFEAIQRAAHNIKGSGASYGFEPISQVGRILEDAARARDVDAIRIALAQLDQYLDRVQVVSHRPPIAAERGRHSVSQRYVPASRRGRDHTVASRFSRSFRKASPLG